MQKLRPKDKKDFAQELLKRQNYKCLICQRDLQNEKICLDHQHCFKYEPLGENGNGLIRGILCNNCNSYEGKIWNNFNRFIKPLEFETNLNIINRRIKILQNIIEYYKNNYQHIEQILHPSENRPELLTKSQYNKIAKYCKENNIKCPKYNKKITKKLKSLLEKLNNEKVSNN